MPNLPSPKNQFALAILLLIEYKSTGVTMKEACKIHFYKYQTRQLEIEKSFDTNGKPRSLSLKIRRLPVTLTNRFGHKTQVTNYKSLASVSYLNNLYRKLNDFGLNGKK